MKRLTPFKRGLARWLKRARRKGEDPQMLAMAKRMLNAPERTHDELPEREWFYPNEIWRSGFRDHLALYTKCNPAYGESVEGSRYREIWGTLTGPNRMRIKIFSVIRDGCLSDRCMSDQVDGIRTITLRKTDKLILIGMKRYSNP